VLLVTLAIAGVLTKHEALAIVARALVEIGEMIWSSAKSR
jgi:hypothetical protein